MVLIYYLDEDEPKVIEDCRNEDNYINKFVLVE